MDQFLVRPSTDGDLDDLARIYAHHVLHSSATFELDPPGRDELAARHAAILALELPYLVAEHAGVVIGYAYSSANTLHLTILMAAEMSLSGERL